MRVCIPFTLFFRFQDLRIVGLTYQQANMPGCLGSAGMFLFYISLFNKHNTRINPMLNPQYKLYINDVWLESLWPAEYYNNKRVYFSTGARRFFTVYQVLRTGDFTLTIVDEVSLERLVFKAAEGFKEWVKQQYPNFLNCLDSVEWGDPVDSRLQPQ
jgi:hypothetical protein